MIVIMLAVTAVACTVTIVHSIDLTIFTLYGSNRFVTGLSPRNALAIEPDQVQKVRALPGTGLLCPAHSYSTMVKTIFGKMVFPIFGLDASGRELFMRRAGVTLAQGRMLRDGEAEAVLSEDVARNLGLKIGDVMSRPESMDSFAPVPIRLVGTLKGRVWLGLTSRELVDRNSPFTAHTYLVFAKGERVADQRSLDSAIARVIDKGIVREWRFSGLVRDTRSSLANLYLILDLVVGIIVFAISFVCGLLSNIYFSQRLPEIATLSAIGYARSWLLARAVSETGLLCLGGWLAGAVTTVAVLSALKSLFLTPRGLLMEPVDMGAFMMTAPLPIAITLFALVTVATRLARLDPVSIIERRT